MKRLEFRLGLLRMGCPFAKGYWPINPTHSRYKLRFLGGAFAVLLGPGSSTTRKLAKLTGSRLWFVLQSADLKRAKRRNGR
jgi:hypothetical protein